MLRLTAVSTMRPVKVAGRYRTKPHLSYSPKLKLWFCTHHSGAVYGSGKTITAAYNDMIDNINHPGYWP